MEVSMLARAIGKTWNALWPKVKHFEEPKDTGRALTPEEEARLLDAVEEARSPVLATFVKGLLLTGMRCGELTGMTWGQVDFENPHHNRRPRQDGRGHWTANTDER